MWNKIQSKTLNLSMSWKTVLIMAVVTGVLTGILAQIPFLANTSFSDIAVSHEWWILFAMLIIVNQKQWWMAGAKAWVFFLVSQTCVFLAEWPLAGTFYTPYWIRWMEISLLTFPGAILAWFALEKNVAGDFFLSLPCSLLCILGIMYIIALFQNPPFHLLTVCFCFLQAVFWLLCLKEGKHLGITLLFTLILTMGGAFTLL